MGKFNGPSDTPRDAPIWVQCIRDLMNQNGMTQKELAEKCGCSTSSISKWVGINKRTEKSGFEKPKPDNMKAIADALGVSVDYLEGEDECKTPSDDEIRKVIGLSGKAVENLKTLKVLNGLESLKESKDLKILRDLKCLKTLNELDHDIPSGEELKKIESEFRVLRYRVEKKLEMLNYLIETTEKSEILVLLYDYLFADFDFLRDKPHFGDNHVKQTLPSGAVETRVIDAEMFSDAILMYALIAIISMKDDIEKQQGEKGGGS